MGCNISELPKDTEQALNQQVQALESIQTAFQAMEETLSITIQKRCEAAAAQQKLLKWKDKSDKKLDDLEAQLTEIIEKNQVAQERYRMSENQLPVISSESESFQDLEMIVTTHREKILEYLEELKREGNL